jgi:apolipoprotein N-acyltransferase
MVFIPRRSSWWSTVCFVLFAGTLLPLAEGAAERFIDGSFWLPIACSSLDLAWVRPLLATLGSESIAWVAALLSVATSLAIYAGSRKIRILVLILSLVLVGLSFFQTTPASFKNSEAKQRVSKIGLLQFFSTPASKLTAHGAEESYREIEHAVVLLKNNDLILLPEGTGAHTLFYAYNGLEDNVYKNWLDNDLSTLAENIILGVHIKTEVNQGEFLNVAIHLSKEQGLFPAFIPKTRLIPLGEYLPPLVRLLGFGSVLSLRGSTFTRKEESNLPSCQSFSVKTKTGLLQVGPAICYDVAFREAFVPKMRSGPVDCFVVLGDNHRFRNFTYADQYFRHARLRAIETRCPVIVLMSAGPSGYVDADGDAHEVVPGFNSKPFEIKTGDFTLFTDEKRHELTMVVRYPNLCFGAAVLAAPFFGFLVYRSSKKGKPTGQPTHGEDQRAK